MQIFSHIWLEASLKFFLSIGQCVGVFRNSRIIFEKSFLNNDAAHFPQFSLFKANCFPKRLQLVKINKLTYSHLKYRNCYYKLHAAFQSY